LRRVSDFLRTGVLYRSQFSCYWEPWLYFENPLIDLKNKIKLWTALRTIINY
jgi:hypothetical protein